MTSLVRVFTAELGQLRTQYSHMAHERQVQLYQTLIQ